jgi:hypothetical protein
MESQNQVNIKELNQIVNTLFSRVVDYCYDIGLENNLMCLENHYDVSKLLNDDTEIGRHINPDILKNKSVYEYVALMYICKLERFTKEIKETLLAVYSKM